MAIYGERALKIPPSVKPREVVAPDNIIQMDTVMTVEKLGELPAKPFYSFVKRAFDVVLSLAGAVLAAVPMLVVALFVKLDSEGPAIYSQERLGKNGKPFRVYKFRSMRVDAEKDGARWASKNDSRVTRVGSFIRKTRLDELPQILNILKGDMSFVGPRPEREVFYNEFERQIRGFRQRMLVKPGLTGWAQINGGYDLRPQEKILYDIEYIKKRSFRMDLKCMVKTVAIVFNHDGAR